MPAIQVKEISHAASQQSDIYIPSPKDMTLRVNLKNYRKKYKSLIYYEKEEHLEVLKAKLVIDSVIK